MPEDIQSPVVDTQSTQPAAPAVEPAAAEPSARQEIYAKYEQAYGTTPTPEPSAPSTVEPASPVAEPAELAVQPGSPAVPDAGADSLAALKAEIVALREQLTPKPPPPPEPTDAEKYKWLELIKEGKIEDAEDILLGKLKAKLGFKSSDEQKAEIQESIRIEHDLSNFVNTFRTANPDLVPAEEWITLGVAAQIETARAQNLIKTTGDYARVYKDAVTKEAEKARKILQLTRAAGKEEASTRSREVLSSTPLAPQAVNTNRQEATKPASIELDVSPESYLASRNNQLAHLRRMTEVS